MWCLLNSCSGVGNGFCCSGLRVWLQTTRWLTRSAGVASVQSLKLEAADSATHSALNPHKFGTLPPGTHPRSSSELTRLKTWWECSENWHYFFKHGKPTIKPTGQQCMSRLPGFNFWCAKIGLSYCQRTTLLVPLSWIPFAYNTSAAAVRCWESFPPLTTWPEDTKEKCTVNMHYIQLIQTWML